MNIKLSTDDVTEPAIDVAAAAVEGSELASGPMFTKDDTTDNPGVASNGDPLPIADNGASAGAADPVGGAAERTEVGGTTPTTDLNPAAQRRPL